LISSQRLAVLLCLFASGIGVNTAVAQQYHSLPSAVTYTEVTPTPHASRAWPGQVTQPIRWLGANRQIITVASQPVATSVQVGPAYAPLQVPPPMQYNSPSQNPWDSVPASVPPQNGWPVYSSGVAYPECAESHSGRSCDWLCRTQKKLRSVYRAGARRSECDFEYPVSTPSGSPYGYVEPTWSQFCPQPSAYPLGPNY
jgi:hypothetical protein